MSSHNTHYTDYKVLEAKNAKELSEKMMHAIHERWQPFGNIAVSKTIIGSEERVRFFQPVVQHAEWFR